MHVWFNECNSTDYDYYSNCDAIMVEYQTSECANACAYGFVCFECFMHMIWCISLIGGEKNVKR